MPAGPPLSDEDTALFVIFVCVLFGIGLVFLGAVAVSAIAEGVRAIFGGVTGV